MDGVASADRALRSCRTATCSRLSIAHETRKCCATFERYYRGDQAEAYRPNSWLTLSGHRARRQNVQRIDGLRQRQARQIAHVGDSARSQPLVQPIPLRQRHCSTNSTRRFLARPSSVRLVATGASGPRHAASSAWDRWQTCCSEP